MLMKTNVCFEKRHETNISIVADDVVDPDLEDETFRAMRSIRKEFSKIAKHIVKKRSFRHSTPVRLAEL